MTPLLLALLVQMTPAQRVAWVPNPRLANGTWVADPSSHLSPGARDSINHLITLLEAETSAEIAVVVVDSLSGLDRQEFALAIHRAWGVGKLDKDNGVVFLWAPNDRDIYISIGNGLEGVLPDRRTGRILDEFVVPAFRDQRFDDGVLAGVVALAAAAREETNPRTGFTSRVARAEGAEPTERAERGDQAWRANDHPFRELFVKILAGIGVIIAGIGSMLGIRNWRRRRPRPCSKCGQMMSLLGEEADDAKLDEGSKAEEKLKSVDWYVWVCACGNVDRIPYNAWLTSYEKCIQCKRRTAKVTSRTQITAATTTSTGLARVDRKCQHCNHTWTSNEVIPKRPVATSSSSGGSFSSGGGGGGSSFGGGSAGGGGAGRSY